MNISYPTPSFFRLLPRVYHDKKLAPALIGVRAGGARGAAAPPNFGQLRFFGQLEKIWAKPVFKDVSMFFISLKRQIFSTLI